MTHPRPPAPIPTPRLTLRPAEPHDRPGFVELFASPEVGAYIGGARPRAELEREIPEVPGNRPGLFVADLDGAMAGMVTLDRHAADGSDGAGYLSRRAGKVHLGYLFLPEVWGRGYAAEACAAALGWFAGACPGEEVMLCTRTANLRALRLAARLGFAEAGRFEEFGAEQWLGVFGGGGYGVIGGVAPSGRQVTG